MKQFNISNRIIMFVICSSLEVDLKSYIKDVTNDFGVLNNEEIVKSISRKKSVKDHFSETLDQLDLFDFIEIIKRQPYKF